MPIPKQLGPRGKARLQHGFHSNCRPMLLLNCRTQELPAGLTFDLESPSTTRRHNRLSDSLMPQDRDSCSIEGQRGGPNCSRWLLGTKAPLLIIEVSKTSFLKSKVVLNSMLEYPGGCLVLYRKVKIAATWLVKLWEGLN